jgi:ABC-type proline/glycine betaine transport system permease subunit
MYGDLLMTMGAFLLIIVAVAVVIAVFYLKNLQDLLNECDPANRQMPPVNVWLMFIPLFNYVYGFIMYPKITETLRREFESRNAPQPGDYLKGLGMAMPILNVAGLAPIQALKGLVGLGGLVLLIIYWVKAAEFKNKLRSLPKGEAGVRFSSNPDLLD